MYNPLMAPRTKILVEKIALPVCVVRGLPFLLTFFFFLIFSK